MCKYSKHILFAFSISIICTEKIINFSIIQHTMLDIDLVCLNFHMDMSSTLDQALFSFLYTYSHLKFLFMLFSFYIFGKILTLDSHIQHCFISITPVQCFLLDRCPVITIHALVEHAFSMATASLRQKTSFLEGYSSSSLTFQFSSSVSPEASFVIHIHLPNNNILENRRS